MNTHSLNQQTDDVTRPGMSKAAKVLAHHSREELSAFVTIAIELMDQEDGDPDMEVDSDFEGECSEDAITTGPGSGRPFFDAGPGCVISDPENGAQFSAPMA